MENRHSALNKLVDWQTQNIKEKKLLGDRGQQLRLKILYKTLSMGELQISVKSIFSEDRDLPSSMKMNWHRTSDNVFSNNVWFFFF